MENLGAKIKALRLKHKLTQTEFADRIGITWVQISYLENGHKWPRYSTLCAIENAFSVKVRIDFVKRK